MHDKQKNEKITPEQEAQMRQLANLILDRIEEDDMKGVLKFDDE